MGLSRRISGPLIMSICYVPGRAPRAVIYLRLQWGSSKSRAIADKRRLRQSDEAQRVSIRFQSPLKNQTVNTAAFHQAVDTPSTNMALMFIRPVLHLSSLPSIPRQRVS
jgi:hypothetical protein